jgi:hypothetical protein
MSDETGFQRFVSALYVGYYVVLGFGFGLLLSDGLPSPWPPGTVSDAAFRYQGASAMVVVITVLHLVLGLYYAEADATLRRRPGQSWTSWYSATRGNWRDLTADALLLVALVVGIVGLGVPPTAAGGTRGAVGAPGGGCTARVGTVAYCGGGNVEIPLAALVLASVGNLFCVWSQLASAGAAGSARGAYDVLNGGRGLGGTKGTSESGGWLELRQVVDPLASAVHLVLLIVICASNPGSDRWGSAAGVALILMQVVAIWAHLFYWINLTDSEPPLAWMKMLFWRLGTAGALQNTRNLYKWLEYAVSATLGTVAVFLSSGDQPTNTLLLLVTLSATIQTVGYSLDQVGDHAGGKRGPGKSSWSEIVQWASAAAGQIVDFIVVIGAVCDHWSDDGDRAVHLVPYIVGWALFGFWNLWVLIRHRPGEDDDDYVEFWYSVFSLVAKAAVFGSTGFYLGKNPVTRV